VSSSFRVPCCRVIVSSFRCCVVISSRVIVVVSSCFRFIALSFRRCVVNSSFRSVVMSSHVIVVVFSFHCVVDSSCRRCGLFWSKAGTRDRAMGCPVDESLPSMKGELKSLPIVWNR